MKRKILEKLIIPIKKETEYLYKKLGIIQKLVVPRYGLYQVIKHQTNGTITYKKEPFVNDRVNIRCVDQYFWKIANQMKLLETTNKVP